MHYATFWQRLAAFLIDGVLLSPFLLAFGWLEGLSKPAAIVVYLIRFVLFLGYQIYCHGQFGQTVGKYAMGIRVTTLNGDKISWKQAWLRSSVELMLGVVNLFGSIQILSVMPSDQFHSVWYDRVKFLADLKPNWLLWLDRFIDVWIWSEFVVMLFNKKRRAIHDFIAGTMVISTRDEDASLSWPQFAD